MQLAGQLDGNVEKAIKRIALEKREKKTISKILKRIEMKNLKNYGMVILFAFMPTAKSTVGGQIQIWLKE
jgi:hypothetical protein